MSTRCERSAWWSRKCSAWNTLPHSPHRHRPWRCRCLVRSQGQNLHTVSRLRVFQGPCSKREALARVTIC